MFYLTTHSTHFIYGYMASDVWECAGTDVWGRGGGVLTDQNSKTKREKTRSQGGEGFGAIMMSHSQTKGKTISLS